MWMMAQAKSSDGMRSWSQPVPELKGGFLHQHQPARACRPCCTACAHRPAGVAGERTSAQRQSFPEASTEVVSQWAWGGEAGHVAGGSLDLRAQGGQQSSGDVQWPLGLAPLLAPAPARTAEHFARHSCAQARQGVRAQAGRQGAWHPPADWLLNPLRGRPCSERARRPQLSTAAPLSSAPVALQVPTGRYARGVCPLFLPFQSRHSFLPRAQFRRVPRLSLRDCAIATRHIAPEVHTARAALHSRPSVLQRAADVLLFKTPLPCPPASAKEPRHLSRTGAARRNTSSAPGLVAATRLRAQNSLSSRRTSALRSCSSPLLLVIRTPALASSPCAQKLVDPPRVCSTPTPGWLDTSLGANYLCRLPTLTFTSDAHALTFSNTRKRHGDAVAMVGAARPSLAFPARSRSDRNRRCHLCDR